MFLWTWIVYVMTEKDLEDIFWGDKETISFVSSTPPPADCMAEVLRPSAWSDHSATRPSVWSLLFQIERWRWRVSIASFITISSLFLYSPIKRTRQLYAKLGNFQSATAQQELWSQEAVSSNHGAIFGLHKKHGFISLVEENCDWKCKMSDVHR